MTQEARAWAHACGWQQRQCREGLDGGRATVAVATGVGDGGGSGWRQRRLWETRARLWLRWLGEEKI